MGLQLIIGGSGSGKTYELYKNMTAKSEHYEKKVERKYFAIVPEQYTMETQKTIVEMSPGHGTLNIDIVSFERLAVRIFEETGKNPGEILDDTGKCMVLRKVMEQQKDKLNTFKSKIGYPGFVDEMKSIISELYQYGICTDNMKGIIEKATKRPLLKAKLEDIAIIEKAFHEYLANQYITSEELMDKLYNAIPESEMIKKSEISLDGFTGFTALQYKVIGQLLKYAENVTVTVTMPSDKLKRPGDEKTDIFSLSYKTISRLKQIAIENCVSVNEIIIDDKMPVRYRENKEVIWLEKHLFAYDGAKYNAENSNIRIYEATDPSKECDFVARQIKMFVQNENYRYKDIAVITGDIEGYYREVEKAFKYYEIPAFTDHKRKIGNNPFIECLEALMKTVDENYSYETMFRFLRCGMTDISREEIDKLENYVVEHGIGSYKRWNSVWADADDDIVCTRDTLMEILEPVYKGLKDRKANVRQFSRTIYNFIVDEDMQEKLNNFEKQFEEEGKLSFAKEYAQIYAKVMELFDKIVFLLGDEKIPLKEYISIFEAGLEEIKVGIIPSTIDRVVVGDIERTRLSNVKVIFMIGVNDGIIPSAGGKGGILSEMDRNFLDECDVKLAPTSRENAFIQKYYLYLNLTKMSDNLIMTYSRASAAGSPLRPSYLIKTMQNKFNKLEIQSAEADENTINAVSTQKTAQKIVARGLRESVALNKENDDLWKELFSAIDLKERDKMLDAAFYYDKADNLENAVSAALYGKVIKGSVSRLESYAECAYKHFLQYGLNLVKRRQHEVQLTDIGTFYHTALERFSQKMRDEKLDWRKIDDSTRKELVDKVVGQVATEYSEKVLSGTARETYQLERMRKITDRTVWALCNQLKYGQFTPEAFEISFDADKNAQTMRYELSDDGKMSLRGKIDRIDLYETEDNIFVKIVDYKSGSKKFDIYDVYQGLQLQLVLYMEAAMDMISHNEMGKKVVPAGIFFYNISDPVIDGDAKEWQETLLDELKPNGVVNSSETVISAMDERCKPGSGKSNVIPVTYKKDGISESKSSVMNEKCFDKLIQYVHEKTAKFGDEIIHGTIEKNPYLKIGTNKTPCDYCEYSQICRFDIQLPGNQYRPFPKIAPEEIWQRINDELKSEKGEE